MSMLIIKVHRHNNLYLLHNADAMRHIIHKETYNPDADACFTQSNLQFIGTVHSTAIIKFTRAL